MHVFIILNKKLPYKGTATSRKSKSLDLKTGLAKDSDNEYA